MTMIVGVAAAEEGRRQPLRRDVGDHVRAIAARRLDIGHRHVEGEGEQEAVVAIVLLLVPHHRHDVQPVADIGERVGIHERQEAADQGQGDEEPEKLRRRRELRKVAASEHEQIAEQREQGEHTQGPGADRGEGRAANITGTSSPIWRPKAACRSDRADRRGIAASASTGRQGIASGTRISADW
jgi:hypothetical protein